MDDAKANALRLAALRQPLKELARSSNPLVGPGLMRLGLHDSHLCPYCRPAMTFGHVAYKHAEGCPLGQLIELSRMLD